MCGTESLNSQTFAMTKVCASVGEGCLHVTGVALTTQRNVAVGSDGTFEGYCTCNGQALPGV